MKQYEVPYNFAYDFEAKLARHPDLFPYIRCIYVPAYVDDCESTRHEIEQRDEYPRTYDEYVIRLKALQQLGLPLCIMLQRGGSLDVFEKYYALGIRMFILNDDALAIAAKERHKDIELTLSITRVATEAEIREKDFSMYDEIVLFYWFNRHLDVVKTLPKKYRYVVIANIACYYDCKWHDEHWYARNWDYQKKATDKCRACVKDLRDTAYIEPENLEYFDPYLSGYKLTDRQYPTDKIIEELERYSNRNVGAIKRSEDYFNVDS